MAIVVLDPGHGGVTIPGDSSGNNATGPTGLAEKAVTLDLAQRTRPLLAAHGIDVRMTRTSDVNVTFKDRAGVAKAAGADAFVSIHMNGFNKAAQGTETYLHTNGSSDSRKLAEALQRAVQKATGLTDRGVKTAGYAVLRPDFHVTGTAACLVEISFLDVAAEEARLKTEAYKKALAEAIADGIRAWLAADGRA